MMSGAFLLKLVKLVENCAKTFFFFFFEAGLSAKVPPEGLMPSAKVPPEGLMH